ncbi:hypothetical protein [uncultured Phenylobacterium sp.]|uniref:hypothetical protein n=1 Tax=uncultured Phenylobacterium sp. TaxID=349273 RepID=UPI0025CFE382|nr:hypothetical protein [uncultured Phenylobacterium sp.]
MRYVGILLGMALAGCASSPTAEEIAASDDYRCQDYGYSRGTEGYAQCRMQIDQQRAQARAAMAAAYLGAGGGQVRRTPQQAYQLPTPK